MRFKLYRENGALNSKPIFDAFEQGLKSLGHTVVDSNEDVSVIWSVLWAGRMAKNKPIYDADKPVIILEVGNLIRNTTWRISLEHINALGKFGNTKDLDPTRPEKLGLKLHPIQTTRRPEILIASQHQQSQQWNGMPNMSQWIYDTVATIRNHTNRNIIVRPHPRSLVHITIPGVTVIRPNLIHGTYDSFDIDYNYHCVVNYNSGPAVQAAINGIPVICDSSSLAGELSGTFENIETISLPSREEWFLKLCHTEWTVEEISQGIPLKRLINLLTSDT